MEELVRTWWVYLVRGACAILFGLLAILWPDITLYALVIAFGAFAIANGVFTLFSSGRGGSRGWMIFSGIVGILTGIVIFVWPGITALVLLLSIASWAVITGILEIVAGIRLRKALEGEWIFIVAGLLSTLFGALLFLWPGGGALAVVWLIGTMAIVHGISLLGLAFTLRELDFHRPGASGSTPTVA